MKWSLHCGRRFSPSITQGCLWAAELSKMALPAGASGLTVLSQRLTPDGGDALTCP